MTATHGRSPLDFLWFLPSAGDQRYLGTTIGARAATPAYLRQIAVAADQLGFSGALLPTGAHCADPKTIASRLEQYAAIGIDTVIGSGYPHLEEAYRVAELLFPHLNLTHATKAAEAPAPFPFTPLRQAAS